MPPLIKELRERTKDLHTRLEELIPVFSPEFSLVQYKYLLERFYGFYSGFDRVPQESGDLPWLAALRTSYVRVEWLKADLKNLGYSDDQIVRLPVCSSFPGLNTSAALLGAVYVLEGSSLGGHFICQRLRKLWGFNADNGAAFFTAYGVDTATRWVRFTAALCAEDSVEKRGKIVEAAVETFGSMWLWLSQGDSLRIAGQAAGQSAARVNSPRP